MGRKPNEQASCPGDAPAGASIQANFLPFGSARAATICDALQNVRGMRPLEQGVVSMVFRFAAGLLMVAFIGSGCSKNEAADHGAPLPPPPPIDTPKPGACATGGGQVDDPISAPFFPRTVQGYCLDPQGETRTFGEKGKRDMDAVCTTAFDGECAVYAQYGLARLVALRYVDGAGGAGTVEVYLSRFGDVGGAYGMFTKRVVADADPAEPSTPKPLEAGAAGALGTGRAYVWKGSYLAELQYNNEEESPEALTASSAKILSAVAKDIGGRLPGGAEKPAAAEKLPKEHLVANGIQYFPKDAPNLGLGGVPTAIGYYKDEAKRYRVVSVVRADAAAAKETMKATRVRPGWLPVPGVGEEALATTLQGAAKSEYVFVRQGAEILGVGDEELGQSKRLTKDEKIALLKKSVPPR
jgi:hypothetical protein